MNRGLRGESFIQSYGDEQARAFIPYRLPPKPPLSIESNIREEIDQG